MIRLRLLLVLALAVSGCASEPGRQAPRPTPAPAETRVEAWKEAGFSGLRVSSPHYSIFTTLNDPQEYDATALVMEGALAEYRGLAPEVPVSQRPMQCYLFADRAQWTDFTRTRTGADASIYLHITRGGYTVQDWYVAYYIGQYATLSVAAHEGFHQYSARNFKMRVPPFLEEGLACMFERMSWVDGKPKWDLEHNESRLTSLRSAKASGRLRPLRELVSMHAGQIVSSPVPDISAFYGESWAFATFLWAGDDGLHRRALQRLLTDAATGKLEGYHARPGAEMAWTPASARLMLERYFGADLETLDAEFRQFVGRMTAHQLGSG